MKTTKVLSLLRDAIGAASLENADFSEVCRSPDRPVIMSDGSPVTERNVTDFIRERVKLHHQTWVIGSIQQALREVKSSLIHKFEAECVTNGYPSIICRHCGYHKLHRSHIE